jgi:acetyl esterase/lipase
MSLVPEQEATISPEAVAFIKNITALDTSSDASVDGWRKAFQAHEDVIEESLVKRFDLRLTHTVLEGVPVLVIDPPTVKPEMEGKACFNIHGGSFVLGTGRERNALLTAGEYGVRVYSVEYTLSPEAHFPVAIEQCLSVYRRLVADIDAENIFGQSSSAGGQIMLSMLFRVQQERLPMMKAAVFYTPAVDLTSSGDSSIFNDGRDVISVAALKHCAQQVYLGPSIDPKDLLASPIYADLTPDFPQSIITTGTRDILLSHSVRLYWKVRELGVPVELLVSEGMWHGYHWESELPEAIRVRASTQEGICRLFKN